MPEAARSVTLEVLRSGGTNGSVSVPWRAVDGSALAGSDYASSQGSVTVPAGAVRASFSVPLLDDGRDEADETFTVVLGGPDAVEPTRAVVRVLDDDAPAPPVVVAPAPADPLPVIAPVAIGTPAPPVSPAPVPPAPAPPAGSPPARTEPPRASLAVAAWQPLARTRALTAAAGCDRPCDLELSGQVALGGGRVVRFARVGRRFDVGGTAPIALRLSARDTRRVRRSLRSRGSLTATVVAAPAGGAAAARRVRVR